MRNFANKQLGLTPSIKDERTLQLKKYFPAFITPPPSDARWWLQADLSNQLGNDRYGNCTYATAGHIIQLLRAVSHGNLQLISDESIIDAAREAGALNGYSLLQRNKNWRTKGICSNRINAFAAFEPQDPAYIRQVIWEFGCADISLLLPNAWQTAEIWDVGTGRDYTPNSWGAHSVPVVGYDESSLYVSTWGEVIELTDAALTEFSDEGFALINSLWLQDDDLTPSDYDVDSLTEDLANITD